MNTRFFLLLGGLLVVVGCGKNEISVPLESTQAMASLKGDFVGSSSCVECHQQAWDDWKASDHHKAMEPATASTVLGNFDNQELIHFETTTRFFKKGEAFWVNAEGPDGVAKDYRIDYTFGFYPLQQYLIEFSRGRYQALQACWDSRSKEEGGQRWFHLYAHEPIPPDDELHWTGPNFNWNYMCADCHVTGFEKSFDVASETYHSKTTESTVGCESCHGPGAKHLAWAREHEGASGSLSEAAMGLLVTLKESPPGAWGRDPETGVPVRTQPLESTVQAETCAPCHSHRRSIKENYVPGNRFLDYFVPNLIDDRLYHVDGQIKEEVYVYGSFTQSKMFHRGVRCTDCHHPHTMKPKVVGNGLCTQCHNVETYDAPTHHFHPTESTGAQCVECHMPHTRYMGVDDRRDHSLRIPRPDLSVSLGVPNACTQCHKDQKDSWAVAWTRKWYGEKKRPPHYGEILQAAYNDEPNSAAALHGLINDSETALMVRAVAIRELGRPLIRENIALLLEALKESEPLIRHAALQGLEGLPPGERIAPFIPLLDDPVRAIRIESARLLALVPIDLIPAAKRKLFQQGIHEYEEAQTAVADRSGAHQALGLLYTDLGQLDRAEAAYRTSIKIDPARIESRLNLAELSYRAGKVDQARSLIDAAVEAQPKNAFTHEALGRHLIRQKDYPAGLAEIKIALDFAPERADLQYFYGVGLNQLNRFTEALPALQKAIELAPGNPDYLSGLVLICRDHKRLDLARWYADQLVRRYPGAPQYRELLNSLQ